MAVPGEVPAGERLDEAAFGDLGIDGDRRYAIVDLGTGFGLTDGTVAADDDALSAWLGRPRSRDVIRRGR